MSMLLALKLALVPAFLAALTVAGRVWGPSVAGWLAGLPVVAGPIVLLLALERGPAFAVTTLSASMGATWSGLLSVFPLLGIVLAVSAQRAHGADFVALLMCGMVIGRGSFAAFFAVTATMLPHYGVLFSFACASAASVAVQGATKRMLGAKRPARTPQRELAEQLQAD